MLPKIITTRKNILFAVAASVLCLSIHAEHSKADEHPIPPGPAWLTYSGESGPGKGKHVILIAAEQEYRSEQSMPMLARVLATHHGFNCTVLFGVNDKGQVDPTMPVYPEKGKEDEFKSHYIAGLEHLEKADLVIFFNRLLTLPIDQQELIVRYLDSGKPIIGLRTANHGFVRPLPYKIAGKQVDFGRDILGGAFMSHHGNWHRDSTRGDLVDGMKDHPILSGVEDIWGPSDVYRTFKVGGQLPQGCTALVMGQPLIGRAYGGADNPNKEALPVAWIKDWKTSDGSLARVFHSTMGSGKDFESAGLRRLVVNASYWCLGLEQHISASSSVETVGNYEPLASGFDYANLGVFPRLPQEYDLTGANVETDSESNEDSCGIGPTDVIQDVTVESQQHIVERSTPAKDAATRLLSVERLFASDEFLEETVGPMQWSQLSESYFTLKASGNGQDLVLVDTASGLEEIVVPANAFVPRGETQPLIVEGFSFSADETKLLLYTNSRRVWRLNTRGDYWVLDVASHELRQLGGDAAPSSLMFAKFSPIGTSVAFVRENNLYVQNLDDFGITALTTSDSPAIINGTADWVNEEELAIRDGYRWSPDGTSIAFWSFDTTGVKSFHLIDNTQGIYPVVTSFPYPKVGTTNSASRIGVVGVKGGETRWLELPEDPREHYLPQMEWAADSKTVMIQQMNRLQNTNRVRLWNTATGLSQTVLTETEETWLENENPVRWLSNGNAFLWLSERNGWRHVYKASTDGERFSAITQGEFDVLSVEAIDEASGWLYFAASPDNPTQRYLYRVSLQGGTPERMSPENQPGWHTYEVSGDANWAVHRYSTFTKPSVVELIRLADHSVVRVLADNAELREKLTQLNLPSAEFFKVDIGNDLLLDGWCLKPPAFDPSSKYPLMLHVYGEPHGQTVRDAWQGTRGLWHWMLAQQGYLVASVDNRGTNTPRGREWRKCVYRKIGIIAPVEQAAATRAMLKQWSFADSGRVGIWGWSGGGSMSLNAIFRYPDLYHTAMAVAPNADQLLYDTIYQERYMGLPDDNADGYRLGSPLTYAKQLRGNLLLVHGTGDDNGHYQGTEMLVNELITNSKHFTLMPYPARTHAIREGSNTVPHFYSLLTNYLHEHLPVSK